MAGESILTSVKKICNVDDAYTAFDLDFVLQINSVFAILNQLGIGPDDGFEIEDKTTTWDEYLTGNLLLNGVKTYMTLRVRMWFDPPQTSHHLTAMQNQISEFESRLNILRESTEWTAPTAA